MIYDLLNYDYEFNMQHNAFHGYSILIGSGIAHPGIDDQVLVLFGQLKFISRNYGQQNVN